jgi:hypothetical protein
MISTEISSLAAHNTSKKHLTRKPGPTPCFVHSQLFHVQVQARQSPAQVSPSTTRKPTRRNRCIAKRLLYFPKHGYCLVLAISMLQKFSVSSIDIVAAYLRSGPLPRRVFVRPPRGWAKPGYLWRLLRPAYGQESGRNWQLVIEKWIFARGIVVVPGAPQVFLLRQSDTLKILVAKMIDDILVCGPPDEIQAFYKDLSRTYKLNPLRTGSKVRFSGMDIVTENDGSTTIEASHYLAACSNIPLSDIRQSNKKSNVLG